MSRGRKITIAVLALTLLAGVAALMNRTSNEFPAGKAGPEVLITVENGEYGSSIAAKLAKYGVVKSASSFVTTLANSPSARAISPGVHRVATHITSKEALTQLLDATRNQGSITIKEGSTYQDVITALKSAGLDFSKPWRVAPYLKNNSQSLEGQLFPAIYSFAPRTPAKSAISAMVEKFRSEVIAAKLNEGYGKYTPYQVLTIASMVQIEGDPSDYAKVARVIYNRLKIGMPLQLNSTVQYAAGLRGRIQLSRNATKIDSPYNTYRNVGLPPTPISNPSTLAINATLHPIEGNWLYFITVAPHDTRFTNDFTTFQDWTTLYNKNLAAGAFR